jgi:hypothetical protein
VAATKALCPVAATGLYLSVALLFTWPLALGLARDIPWDLGDSVLNCWILAWNADHLLRFLSGDFQALKGLWSGNIFHPEPLTLAYSEHLFAQSVQILPIYALTNNIILCYNLLFLSTFVLSGLGTYLFVREVTGSARAGFVAGLIYAFAPIRVPQFAHLQVISSQWMPFVLYGLRRYYDSRRLRPLIGAGVALLAQNLSCGYFLMFFAPLIAAYVLFEVASRRLWTDVRMWGAVGTMAALVIAATVPFLLPYVELRRLGFPARTLSEVKSYAADVFSYWTSPSESRLWGQTIRAFPKSEGDLFPTLSALLLGAIGIAASIRAAWNGASGPVATTLRLRPLSYLLGAAALFQFILLIVILTGNGFSSLGSLQISVRNFGRNLRFFTIALAALLVVSPRARSFARQWAGSIAGFAVLAALAAFFLSLGPEMRANGRLIGDTAPYAFFYANVPGFDGLRVPARYGMLFTLFLAIVCGVGVLELQRFKRGAAAALVIGLFSVVESIAAPIAINATVPEQDLVTPPNRLFTGSQIPPVYRFLGTLPSPQTVIVEFPFNRWAYEVQYMFYSAVHWHPMLNGYSGTFPLSYSFRSMVLARPEQTPDAAWQALAASGATHAIVHEKFYTLDRGKVLSDWLMSRGARLVGEFDGDKVFALR